MESPDPVKSTLNISVNTSQPTREHEILRLLFSPGSRIDSVHTVDSQDVKIIFRSEIGASTSCSADGTVRFCPLERASAAAWKGRVVSVNQSVHKLQYRRHT